MKIFRTIYWTTLFCGILLSAPLIAQLNNQGVFVNIASGTTVVANNGVINANGGTITVEGTLTTPADLTNTSGATLQGNGQYNVSGNWTNSATFNAGTSTVTFEGTQNSTVSSGGSSFYNVALNKTGGNNLLLGDNMAVSNSLEFQAANNYVVLGDYNLQVVDIIGYDASRHVRTTGAGFLARTVDGSPALFPVGNSAYNPAILTNAGTSDQYRVRVSDAVLSNGFSGSAYTANAVDRSWVVEEGTPGGSDLTMELQWNGSEELPGFDRTMSYVSHFDAGTWDNQTSSAAAGTGPFTQTRTGITSLSPFAVLGNTFIPTIDILGRIIWKGDGDTGVKDATVTASGDLNGMAVSDVVGDYSMTFAGNGDVSLVPSKTINLLNGVDIGDKLAIQQHLVGLNTINDPYAQIAMDINRDNSISTFDAVIISQALLNNPLAFNYFNISWRFVPKNFVLSLPPWGFPEQIDLIGVTGNQTDQDFYGVKIGDVVATFANPANFGAGMKPLVWRVQDHMLEAGQMLEVSFNADYLENLAACQFALQFDPQYLALESVEPLTALPMSTDNFGLFQVQQGKVRTIWSQPQGLELPAGSEVFRLRFKALESGVLLSTVLGLDETVLPGLAYNRNLEHAPVQMYYDASTATGTPANAVTMFDAWPNPFVQTTTVRFNLPEACKAQLRVFDASGRELLQMDKNYPAGNQQEPIRLEGMSGTLVCELTTPWGTQRLKLITAKQ